jgi:hypothetical protein
MHGGAHGSGAQPGNRNALKHGQYTAAAVSRRRELRALLRAVRELVERSDPSTSVPQGDSQTKKAPPMRAGPGFVGDAVAATRPQPR